MKTCFRSVPFGSAWINEWARFLLAWSRNPLRTGAVAPSSKGLSKKMATMAAPPLGTRVVELGPGTGVVTAALLKVGVREQDLVLVELDPQFALQLRERYPQATILEEDAITVVSRLAKSPDKQSTIVSSLPLFAFSKADRATFARCALKALLPDGKLVQFTYNLVSPIEQNQRIRVWKSRRIWRNIPPATVWAFGPK